MGPLALGYVGVNSPNYEEWLTFAPEVLAAAVDRGPDGSVLLKFDDRHHRFAIHPGDEDGLAYLGWEYLDHDQLERAIADVEGHGFSVKRASQEEADERAVAEYAYFTDPFGFRHELFWGQVYIPRSFYPPRPHGGFVTDPMGMGHAVFMVPDLEKGRRFILDVLGLRFTDEVDVHGLRVAFFRANARHHSLAIMAMGDVAALQHVMFQVRELDDVGIAHDVCLRKEVPMLISLGRHHNDRMLSFYFQTPSGFAIEYGWGGLEIDDDTWVPALTKAQEIWGHEFSGVIPGGD